MCDHKHQTFIGYQKCGGGMPDLAFYNCDECHTTLARPVEDIADLVAKWITNIGTIIVLIAAITLLIYNLVR